MSDNDKGLRMMAESIYESNIEPLLRRISSLEAERDKYRNALERISKLRWGNDGGVLAIIDEVL